MKKVPAVSEVRVSLKDGLTLLELKPDNDVTLAQLRQVIKNNGFVPKEAQAVVVGMPASDGNVFVVSGTNERLSLSQPAQKNETGEWNVKILPPTR